MGSEFYRNIAVGYALAVASIGQAIKQRRKGLDLTQIQFGRKLGMSQSSVSQWETGETKPDAEQLIRIAIILKCSVDDLALDADPEYRKHRERSVTYPVTGIVVKGGAPEIQSPPSEGSARAEAVAVRTPEILNPLGVARTIYKHVRALSALADSLVQQSRSHRPPGASAPRSGRAPRAAGVHGRTGRGRKS